MSEVPRSAPVPSAVRAALESKTLPAPNVLENLSEKHRRLVTVYARLNAKPPTGAPTARKVLDR